MSGEDSAWLEWAGSVPLGVGVDDDPKKPLCAVEAYTNVNDDNVVVDGQASADSRLDVAAPIIRAASGIRVGISVVYVIVTISVAIDEQTDPEISITGMEMVGVEALEEETAEPTLA